MTESTTESLDIVFLRTGLFGEQTELLEAVDALQRHSSTLIELRPERMGEADWDAVIARILQAGKVVTL